jgi:TadE-like protein
MRSLPARLRARWPGRRSERGVSSLELVLYMPLLMTAIFITVQFSLLYLGNQVVSSAARQAARVARTTGDQVAAEAKGKDYADKVGHGLVEHVEVNVVYVDNGTPWPDIKVVVSGQALQLVPRVEVGEVTKTVQGPSESFRPDGP